MTKTTYELTIRMEGDSNLCTLTTVLAQIADRYGANIKEARILRYPIKVEFK